MANEIDDIIIRLSIIEKKLQDIEVKIETRQQKQEKNNQEILDKLFKIRCELCAEIGNNANSDELFDQLNQLEEQVDAIRIELPEIRLTKQIVMGLVAIILTSVVGILWNAVVVSKEPAENVNEIVKKLVNEYTHGEKK
jgi:thiamine kinase-like enzyme